MHSIYVVAQKKAFSVVLYKSDDYFEEQILRNTAICEGLIKMLGANHQPELLCTCLDFLTKSYSLVNESQ